MLWWICKTSQDIVCFTAEYMFYSFDSCPIVLWMWNISVFVS